MSYDLDIFRGDIDEGEERWAPLDPAVARAGIEDLPGVSSSGDEWYWPVGALIVSLLLGRDSQETLRSVGVGVNVTRSVPSEDLRRDYEQALRGLLLLAQRLEARLFDAQLDDYVEPAAIEEAVASFA